MRGGSVTEANANAGTYLAIPIADTVHPNRVIPIVLPAPDATESIDDRQARGVEKFEAKMKIIQEDVALKNDRNAQMLIEKARELAVNGDIDGALKALNVLQAHHTQGNP